MVVIASRYSIRASLMFGLLAAAMLGSTVLGQSELVIHKEGTTVYHRPGCPVIRDSAGLLAMTRAQAEARGYKPHPACDPANPSARRSAPADESNSAATQKAPAAVTVYLDGSKYYHRKECPRLKSSGKPVEPRSLELAARTFWPCPDCRPPIRKRSTPPAAAGSPRRGR